LNLQALITIGLDYCEVPHHLHVEANLWYLRCGQSSTFTFNSRRISPL